MEVLIKISQSGHRNLEINGTYLHSMVNPIKEATGIINRYQESIDLKNNFLVLGCGLGYHIEELSNRLFNKYNKNYKIQVIEPSLEIFTEYQKIKTSNSNIEYLVNLTICDLFKSHDHLQFLYKKPTIIYHAPSFKVAESYFKDYLSHRDEQDLKNIIAVTKSCKIQEILGRYETTKEVLEQLMKKSSLDYYDMIMASSLTKTESK